MLTIFDVRSYRHLRLLHKSLPGFEDNFQNREDEGPGILMIMETLEQHLQHPKLRLESRWYSTTSCGSSLSFLHCLDTFLLPNERLCLIFTIILETTLLKNPKNFPLSLLHSSWIATLKPTVS